MAITQLTETSQRLWPISQSPKDHPVMEERPTIINRVRSSNTLRTRARARARARASDILQIALLLSLVALKDQPNTVG